MHLRRALLLFAIVLGLSAIVASISHTNRGKDHARSEPVDVPPTAPKPGSGTPLRVTFSSTDRHMLRRVPVRRALEVTVTARRPGLAAIGGLDQSGPTEPATPARFEVFQARPGRFPVSFTPAGTNRSQRLGTLALVRR